MLKKGKRVVANVRIVVTFMFLFKCFLEVVYIVWSTIVSSFIQFGVFFFFYFFFIFFDRKRGGMATERDDEGVLPFGSHGSPVPQERQTEK